MKKIIFALFFLGASVATNAQQQYQHSQYQQNPYLMNPAASGVYEYLDISLGLRQQWVGFKNAPRNFYISGHKALGGGARPLYNPSLRVGGRGSSQTPDIKTGKMKHAIGGYAFADEYGAFKHYNVMGTYAIHIPVAKGYNLSGGVGVGYSQYSFDQNEVDMLDDNDSHYAQFLGNGLNQGYLDLTAGLWFYSNELFVGYSSGELLKSLVYFGSDHTNFNLQMHHFFTAGYNIAASPELTITPSVLIKAMAPAPLSVDVTCTATYDKFIWFGLTYRHRDAMVGILGININNMFKFGYSYDFTISKLNSFNRGGHEIVLGLTLGK